MDERITIVAIAHRGGEPITVIVRALRWRWRRWARCPERTRTTAAAVVWRIAVRVHAPTRRIPNLEVEVRARGLPGVVGLPKQLSHLDMLSTMDSDRSRIKVRVDGEVVILMPNPYLVPMRSTLGMRICKNTINNLYNYPARSSEHIRLVSRATIVRGLVIVRASIIIEARPSTGYGMCLGERKQEKSHGLCLVRR
jgi:hypothetical protein